MANDKPRLDAYAISIAVGNAIVSAGLGGPAGAMVFGTTALVSEEGREVILGRCPGTSPRGQRFVDTVAALTGALVGAYIHRRRERAND